MKDYSNCGLTQKGMSQLVQLSPATISRYISSKNLEPIRSEGIRKLRYPISTTREILKSVFSKNLEVKKKTQAFYNFKGGTGKTSICYQTATHFALLGFNVLVVDSDPQGHLSTSLGFSNEDNLKTLYDQIVNDEPIEEVIKNVFPGLDCIPANLSLTRLEVELNQLPKREERISIALRPVEDKYDFIFFDTNPTISHLNRNIITFSQVLNIVCETQPYSLNGLKLLFEDLERFYQSMQMTAADTFIIPNKYEDRTSSSAEAMTVLREFYSQYLKVDFAIRKSEDINYSAKSSLPLLFFCKSNSNALEDIIELIHYILEKCTKRAGEIASPVKNMVNQSH